MTRTKRTRKTVDLTAAQAEVLDELLCRADERGGRKAERDEEDDS
jgi:hypothetical protein